MIGGVLRLQHHNLLPVVAYPIGHSETAARGPNLSVAAHLIGHGDTVGPFSSHYAVDYWVADTN